MKLPVLSGADAVQALGRAGYEFDEQHGSHIILRPSTLRTDVSRFPTTKNWAKGRFARLFERPA